VSVDPCIEYSCDTVGWRGDPAKVASPCWASGESKVRPLLEGTLGRVVNPSGSAAFAQGWARAWRDRVS
jgi:hypothetical protein